MSRRRQLDLTDQQERVLELMARGRTNFEIAQTLDMTLDGAKYHIRQVFDKLGVDSREEAVTAWKDSRGSVFERVRGFFWPVGALAAGGAVVIAVVIGALALGGVFASGKSAAGGSIAPGVWVAEIVPQDPGQDTSVGALKVFNANDATHARTFPGNWSMGTPGGSVAWSPTGLSLAVVGQATPKSRFGLWIFDRSTGAWKSTNVAILPGYPFGWSPDGQYLAFGDLEPDAIRVTLVSHAGSKIAHADLPPLREAAELQLSPLWAPNADAAAWAILGKLAVVSPRGGHVYDPPAGTATDGMKVTGWADAETLAVTTSEAAYAVHLDGDRATWTKLPAPIPSPTRVVPGDLTPGAAVESAWATATAAQLVGAGLTADGTGKIFKSAFNFATTDRSHPSDQHAVVQHDGQATVVDLGERIPQPDLLGDWYDIVITK